MDQMAENVKRLEAEHRGNHEMELEHLEIATKRDQSAVEMEDYARLIEKERVKNALLEQ